MNYLERSVSALSAAEKSEFFKLHDCKGLSGEVVVLKKDEDCGGEEEDIETIWVLLIL